MSRGSAVDYEADEQAGVARLRWRTFVGNVISLLFNMLSRLVINFLPRKFNFMAAVTICSDFGAPQNSLTLFPRLFAMK